MTYFITYVLFRMAVCFGLTALVATAVTVLALLGSTVLAIGSDKDEQLDDLLDQVAHTFLSVVVVTTVGFGLTIVLLLIFLAR